LLRLDVRNLGHNLSAFDIEKKKTFCCQFGGPPARKIRATEKVEQCQNGIGQRANGQKGGKYGLTG